MTKIRISLLPDEMKRQSSIMRAWTIIATVLAVIAMIVLAGNILLAQYVKEPVAELDHLKIENQTLTNNIGRLSYVKEMFDSIEATKEKVKELKGLDPDWVYAIDLSSSDATLFGVKIDRMEIATGGETPGCTMTCWTYDIDDIDRWEEYIKGTKGIEDVRITDINTLVLPGNKLEFQFKAVLGIDEWNAE